MVQPVGRRFTSAAATKNYYNYISPRKRIKQVCTTSVNIGNKMCTFFS